MKYAHVFEPIQIGAVTVKNRLYASAHHSAFASGGLVNERHYAYHEARAKGGLGMIILGAQIVKPHLPHLPNDGFDDEPLAPGQVERYKELTRRVKRHGTTIIAQIAGLGRQDWMVQGHMQVSAAPSALPAHGLFVPREIDEDGMAEIEEQFTDAARAVRDGGFDGVEFHCAYGYLMASFLSPVSNKRMDEYGGSLENRLRFPLRVLKSMREVLGPDKIIGVRLLADEYNDLGIGLEESSALAKGFEDSGLVDYINATIGTYDRKAMITYPMFLPMGLTLDMASNIKNAVDIPVLTAGRIKDPAMMEAALAERKVDMIGMARAIITEPELANKMLEGRDSEIRNCIGCNQKCNGNLMLGLPISCMQNPSAGKEYLPFWSELTTPEKAKNIAVIGGGPAGCEAAYTLAKRSHNVTVYERANELGGQLTTVAKIPGREEWQDVFRFHTRELDRLGVNVRLGVDMSVDDILALNADDVVLATGSEARTLPYPNFGELDGVEKALNVRDVVNGKADADIGDVVTVYAGDDHMQGISTAELLLDMGKEVHIVVTAERPSPLNEMFMVEQQCDRLGLKGLAGMHLHSKISSFDGEKVVVEHMGTVEHTFEIPCDTLVSSFGGQADQTYYRALKGKVPVHCIGDCLSPRTSDFAIFDGAVIGREL